MLGCRVATARVFVGRRVSVTNHLAMELLWHDTRRLTYFAGPQ